jgi:hypothetical protein
VPDENVGDDAETRLRPTRALAGACNSDACVALRPSAPLRGDRPGCRATLPRAPDACGGAEAVVLKEFALSPASPLTMRADVACLLPLDAPCADVGASVPQRQWLHEHDADADAWRTLSCGGDDDGLLALWPCFFLERLVIFLQPWEAFSGPMPDAGTVAHRLGARLGSIWGSEPNDAQRPGYGSVR